MCHEYVLAVNGRHTIVTRFPTTDVLELVNKTAFDVVVLVSGRILLDAELRATALPATLLKLIVFPTNAALATGSVTFDVAEIFIG